MTRSETVTISTLTGIDAFRDLNSAERSEIADLLQMEEYAANQFVISRSRPTGNVYFLISGKIRACMYSATGREIQFEDLQPGMMFGEISAIDGGARTSDCVALEAARLVCTDATAFNRMMSYYPAFNSYVVHRLAGLVRRKISRVYEYSAYPVKDRVRFELVRMASEAEGGRTPIVIKNPPTHSDIASRISSHREAVTRELKRLESLELIDWRPGNYRILDLAGLTASASSG